jgi:hypothetical protein
MVHRPCQNGTCYRSAGRSAVGLINLLISNWQDYHHALKI